MTPCPSGGPSGGPRLGPGETQRVGRPAAGLRHWQPGPDSSFANLALLRCAPSASARSFADFTDPCTILA